MKLSWLPGILCVVLCLVLPQEGSSGAKNQHSFDSDTEDISASLISKAVQNKAYSIQHNSTELNDMSAKSHHLMKENENSRIIHYLSRVKRSKNHYLRYKTLPNPDALNPIVPWGKFKKYPEYNRYYWGFPNMPDRPKFINELFKGIYNSSFKVGSSVKVRPKLNYLFGAQAKKCKPIRGVHAKPFDCMYKKFNMVRTSAYTDYIQLRDKSKFPDIFRLDSEQLVCIIMFLR